jgi:mannitol/fructose-specific phosphotransferase system IIA component (Ntr-type)
VPTLEALTDPQLIFPALESTDAQGVLGEMAARLAEAGAVGDAAPLLECLWEREQLGTTAIGHGVAIPHCKLDGLDRVVVAVGFAPAGVDFGAADGQPVRLFFLVASPSRSPAEHLQCLAAISRWVRSPQRVERLLAQHEPGAILELLREGA